MNTRKRIGYLMCAVGLLAATVAVGTEPPVLKPVSGLCYGPFREGQFPGGEYPTVAQMEEDLMMLRNITYAVRTYGSEPRLAWIPWLCSQAHLPLACYPGAWIDNAEGDNAQVAGLIEIAQQEYRSVKGLIVGSEFLLREEQRGHSLQPAIDKLLAYIAQVKEVTGVPVTVAEPWHIWNYDSVSSLAAEVDFIMIHVHPYWESPYWTPPISIDTAAQHVLDRYDQIRARYPGKRVVIGETGWPTAGPSFGAAVPGLANQERFLREFADAAHARGIEYFFFEAFDEPWKDEGGVGAHWGLLDKDRHLKFGLSSRVRDHTRITSLTPTGIEVGTYELSFYQLQSSANLEQAEWEDVTLFWGTKGAHRTHVFLPSSNTNLIFYRVRTQWGP